MNKFTPFLIALLAVAAATVIIAQRQSESKLREENRILRVQRDQLPDAVLREDNHSPRAQETTRSKPIPNGPLTDLPRLRGEVARLRQSLLEFENLRKENGALQTENDKLRGENRLRRGPSWKEMYTLEGFDPDSIPELEPGASKESVLAKLGMIDSKILADEETFVHVDIFPVAAASRFATRPRITMELYFEAGKLGGFYESRQKTSDPN